MRGGRAPAASLGRRSAAACSCPKTVSCSALAFAPLPPPQVRDGLRAVKNTIEDGATVAGAGAFEVAAAHHLRTKTVKAAEGR